VATPFLIFFSQVWRVLIDKVWQSLLDLNVLWLIRGFIIIPKWSSYFMVINCWRITSLKAWKNWGLDITKKWYGWNFYQTLQARSRIGNNLTKYGEKNNETIKKYMLKHDKDLPFMLILLYLKRKWSSSS